MTARIGHDSAIRGSIVRYQRQNRVSRVFLPVTGLVPVALSQRYFSTSERIIASVKSAPSIIAPLIKMLVAKAPSRTALVKLALVKRADSKSTFLILASLKSAPSKLAEMIEGGIAQILPRKVVIGQIAVIIT